VDASGRERLLTRGWLRGSQRRLDEDASRPWAPAHRHVAREPVPRGEVVRYELEMRPYAIRLMPGERLALRLRCRDDERPGTDLEWIGQGHLWRPTPARLLVRHCPEHPSSLLLPIVRGNRIGTFVSGGRPGLSMT
jgi:predicted acyl esterase